MDYLNKYANKRGVNKFQEGGAMPAPEAAPAGGGAPAGGIEEMLMQYAQTRDPQLAVAICDMIVEQMGGGAAPAPAPAMSNGGRMSTSAAPVFRKGGKLKA